jgi:cytochrome oxidase Cu insertion factor (SCO1/SenC/PrrC family)
MRKLLTLLFVTVLALTTMVVWLTQGTPGKRFSLPAFRPAQEAAQPQQAQIGGHFKLTDQHGKEVDEAQFRGKYMLVYFGFSRCPDLCPVSLGTITSALEKIGDKANEFAPVFISLDPEHDTPQVLAEYMKSFYPSFEALTGTQAQVDAVAEGYKVYHARKDAGPEGAAAPAGEAAKADYTVDHSGFIYLLDREGQYVSLFTHDVTPEELAAKLTAQLEPVKE